MPSVRRLAAILAADVAGYSRLMGADEEGTHERLKAHLRELVEPKIAEHRGRVVKNTGDGFLAEFASVVDAVRCATEIQRGMMDREPEVPEAAGRQRGDHLLTKLRADECALAKRSAQATLRPSD
jgi:class 3 adenylate cyclase